MSTVNSSRIGSTDSSQGIGRSAITVKLSVSLRLFSPETTINNNDLVRISKQTSAMASSRLVNTDSEYDMRIYRYNGVAVFSDCRQRRLQKPSTALDGGKGAARTVDDYKYDDDGSCNVPQNLARPLNRRTNCKLGL